MRALFGRDPYAAKAITQRRAAVLDFVAAALFTDREAGVRLAAEIALQSDQPRPLPPASGAADGRGEQI